MIISKHFYVRCFKCNARRDQSEMRLFDTTGHGERIEFVCQDGCDAEDADEYFDRTVPVNADGYIDIDKTFGKSIVKAAIVPLLGLLIAVVVAAMLWLPFLARESDIDVIWSYLR